MGHRNSRKKDKAGINHVVVFSHTHNAGIWVHPPDHRIAVAGFMGKAADGSNPGFHFLCRQIARMLLGLDMSQIKGRYQICIGPGQIQPSRFCKETHQLKIFASYRIMKKAVPFLITGFQMEGMACQLLYFVQIAQKSRLKGLLSDLFCG